MFLKRLRSLFMHTRNRKLLFSLIFLFVISNLFATKLDTVKVVDQDYIMIHFKDGIVDFVDDGFIQSC